MYAEDGVWSRPARSYKLVRIDDNGHVISLKDRVLTASQ